MAGGSGFQSGDQRYCGAPEVAKSWSTTLRVIRTAITMKTVRWKRRLRGDSQEKGRVYTISSHSDRAVFRRSELPIRGLGVMLPTVVGSLVLMREVTVDDL